MMESIVVEAQERKADQSNKLTQNHPLIRSGEDYAPDFVRIVERQTVEICGDRHSSFDACQHVSAALVVQVDSIGA
jgi:hypothetical protein